MVISSWIINEQASKFCVKSNFFVFLRILKSLLVLPHIFMCKSWICMYKTVKKWSALIYFLPKYDKFSVQIGSKIWLKMCEMWQSVSLYISFLSMNQQDKGIKMSELGGGSLKTWNQNEQNHWQNVYLKILFTHIYSYSVQYCTKFKGWVD